MKLLPLLFAVFMAVTARSQIITSVAGSGATGFSGDGGPATAAAIGGNPYGVACDNAGNYYFSVGQVVRKVSPGGIITTVVGTGWAGYSGDGGPATSAQLNFPTFLACDRLNNLYITDRSNHVIRKVDALSQIITTVAGTGIPGFSGDGGPATGAQLSVPYGICCDTSNNLFIADFGNNRVRKVNTLGFISTFAGTGSPGYSGDGWSALLADLVNLRGICSDRRSNIYVATGVKVRKVTAVGVITTYAGGAAFVGGDGGPATAAGIDPFSLIMDANNNLFIGQNYNNNIRKVDSFGIITTYAGNGVGGFSGDGGPAIAAKMEQPYDIAVDGCNNLFIADGLNYRIRKVEPPSPVLPVPAISVSPSDTVCPGTAATYSVAITGAMVLDYQWHVNGTAVMGGTSTTYTYTPSNGDAVTCVAILNTSCNYETSPGNIINMVVNPIGIPTINVVPAPNDTVCVGTLVTFNSSVTGAGSSPSYQWFVNGAPVATGSSYAYTPANGDSIRCAYTSTTCSGTVTVNSNITNMVVNPVLTPTITITPMPGDTVCAGSVVTFSSLVAGGGPGSAFHWYVNGVPVTTFSSYSYIPSNGDSVRCTYSTTSVCGTVTVSSNTINMVVDPLVVPSVSIIPSPNDTVCAGTVVTFSSTVAGGGTASSYQWYVNGVVVSAATGYSYTPSNGDSIRCAYTSSSTCGGTVSISSNTINMVVNGVVTPTVNITASPNDTVCAGTLVTFNSWVTVPGLAVSYQWYVNGVVAGTSATHFYIPSNGDSIRCVYTCIAACGGTVTVSSNTINMVVNSVVTPTASISVAPNDTVCTGTPVTFTAIVSGGSAMGYTWYKNGSSVSSAGITCSFVAASGDSVRCVVNSAEGCTGVPLTLSSNSITVTVLATTTPSISITGISSAAVGSMVTVNATVIGAVAYTINWMNKGVLFNTTTVPVVTYTKATGTDSITAQVIPAGVPCYDLASSNLHLVTMNKMGMTAPSLSVINIYPNPANDQLTIENAVGCEMKIIDIVGREVYRVHVNGERQAVDITRFQSGVYMMQFRNEDGMKVMRMVKK